MRIELIAALLSSIAVALLLKRIKSFCNDNNMSYEVMVRLNRSLSRRYNRMQVYTMNAPKVESINIKEYIWSSNLNMDLLGNYRLGM